MTTNRITTEVLRRQANDARHDANVTSLASAIAKIRKAFPTVTAFRLTSSDQNYYGFWLAEVIVPEPGPDHDSKVSLLVEDVYDDLASIDWHTAVGEDRHGNATLQLPPVEPIDAATLDGEHTLVVTADNEVWALSTVLRNTPGARYPWRCGDLKASDAKVSKMLAAGAMLVTPATFPLLVIPSA